MLSVFKLRRGDDFTRRMWVITLLLVVSRGGGGGEQDPLLPGKGKFYLISCYGKKIYTSTSHSSGRGQVLEGFVLVED